VEAIEREQMRLLQFYHIPGNQQETDLEYKYFNEFRMEIEVSHFKLFCDYFKLILQFLVI
jgi:hypothetical protein